MRLLLDTHALLWWLAGDQRLSRAARFVIDAPDAEVLVSVVSVFEIATKNRIGKLPLRPEIAADLIGTIVGHGFGLLPLDPKSASSAASLPARIATRSTAC